MKRRTRKRTLLNVLMLLTGGAIAVGVASRRASILNWIDRKSTPQMSGPLFFIESTGFVNARDARIDQIHALPGGRMAIVLVIDPQPLFGQPAGQLQVCGFANTPLGQSLPVPGSPLIWCDLTATDLEIVLREGIPQSLSGDLVKSVDGASWNDTQADGNVQPAPIILPANKYFGPNSTSSAPPQKSTDGQSANK